MLISIDIPISLYLSPRGGFSVAVAMGVLQQRVNMLRVGALILLLCFPATAIAAHDIEYDQHKPTLSRKDFPEGFVFGTATSAYQIEGAAHEGGRGPSIWDNFSQTRGNILGNGNGNVASDQYHHYKEDISLMSFMGMDAYRFSISWPRIYPDGRGKVNELGIAYYNHLIDGLLEKGIVPFVTLYHWDLPQKLEDEYHSWLSPRIVQDYANYADTCFKYFGDRVKHWITFNEPTSFILSGYDTGVFPPRRCSKWVGNCTKGNSMTEPYIAAHNMLRSHVAAVDIYRSKYKSQQKGKISMTLYSAWYIPLTNSLEDQKAVSRILDFTLGWYLDPLIYGDYPKIMKNLVGDRLPKFTNEEKKKLRQSVDFLGINYYTTNYVGSISTYPNPQHTSFYEDSMTILTGERNGIGIGPQAASSWLYIYPRGIYDLLTYIKKRYSVPVPIYITENGVDEANNATLPLKEALQDTTRINFYQEHLSNLSLAIKEGVDVQGFFAWSLLDNFEWTWGYTVRFGIYFVDFHTLERYPKLSVSWFKELLQRNM